MRKQPIEVGDRFSKFENPQSIWVVQRLVFPPGLPPHVEVVAERYQDRKILLSSSVLSDDHFYRKIERE